jgi:hypothetical protein
MSSYSHEPDELLQSLRGDLPGAAEKDRVRARLLALGVAASALAPAATLSAQATSGSALGKVGLFGGKKLLLALALTGAAGTALWTGVNKLSAPVAEMRTLPSAESSQLNAPGAARQEPRPVVTALEPGETALPSSAVQRRSKRARIATPRQNTASTLRAESVLLSQAIAALRAGQLAEAERLLALHRAQFPAGLLAHERELAQERLNKARLEP